MDNLPRLLFEVESASLQLAGPAQAVLLERLEAVYPKLVAALQSCLDSGEDANGLRLCIALGKFWWMCGHAPEGRRWLEAFLSRPIDDQALRARALLAAAGADYAQADYPATQRYA